MPFDTTPDAIVRLIQALRYGEAPERRAALGQLAEIGPLATEAIPDLIAALRDREDSVRSGAAAALAGMGPAAVVSLVEAMLDDDVEFRKTVIETLGRIGADAAGAVPVLLAARTNPELAGEADSALERIKPPPLAALRPHLVGTLPLALLITGVAAVVAGATATVLWLADLLRPGNPLAVTLGTAFALLGAGVGAIGGASTWGRVGAVVGLVVFAMLGYTVGVFIAGLASLLLGSLGR